MLERRLSQLLTHSVKRAAGERSIPWAIIVACAFLLRRALRDEGDEKTFTVKRGKTMSISVVDQDG